MTKIGIDRIVESIQVGDRTFDIRLVPIHAEILIVQHDIIEKDYEIKLAKKPSEELLQEKMEKCFAMLFEVLNDILIANDYELDKEWWERHIDVEGLVEFIALCKAKDLVSDAIKKKAKAVLFSEIDFEKLFWSLKSKGIVNEKYEFYYQMDLADLESAGAFLEKHLWDKFILKESKDKKIVITPTDFTRRH